MDREPDLKFGEIMAGAGRDGIVPKKPDSWDHLLQMVDSNCYRVDEKNQTAPITLAESIRDR